MKVITMFNFKTNASQPSGQGALNEKLEKIRTHLGSLNGASGAQKVGGEGATLTDDAPLPADKRAAIAKEEALVRGALQVVGIDYDALIAQEGQEGKGSAYAQAVAANPSVLKQVMEAESPVLAALNVAMGYKPYAEFTAKYGADPAAIKAAIKAEALAEAQAEGSLEGTPPATKSTELPFSRKRTSSAAGATGQASNGSLKSVFQK